MSYSGGDMSLRPGGLQPQDLHSIGQHDSMSISEDDDLVEIDISDPPDVRQRSRQLLQTPPDLSRVGASQGIDGAREVGRHLPGQPLTRPVTEGVVVHHPLTHHEMSIPREMLPSTIPSDMTQAELTRMVQDKVTHGYELVQMILNNDDFHPDPSTQGDITDIMWFLHTTAEYKAGAGFKEGALSIEDPDGRLQRYFDRCEGHAYQRLSTHVEGFQEAPGGKPRGIDCYGDARNPDGLLPYGQQTILYQKMGRGTGDVPHMPRNMLMLKMEKYGAFSAGQQVEGRGPTRAENQHDRGAFWGHVGTTIKSIARRIFGLNTPEGSRKERVSSGMQKAYDQMSSWKLKNLGSNLPSECRDILKRGAPGNTASGVRVMSRNVNDAIQWLQRNGGTPQELQRLTDFRDKYLTNPHWDHMDMRIGNEVILTQEDIDSPDQLVHSEGTTASRMTTVVDKDHLVNSCFGDIQVMLGQPEGTDTHRDLQPTPNGVSRQFETDFMDRFGGKVVIGGREIPWSPDDDPRGQGRLDAMKAFFTDQDGNLDEVGLLTASRLINQAMTATLVKALQTDQLGTQTFPGMVSRPTAMSQSYELSRDTEGQVHIRVRMDQQTDGLRNTTTDTDIDLDDIGGAHFHQEMGLMMPRHGATTEDVEVVDVTYKMTTRD